MEYYLYKPKRKKYVKFCIDTSRKTIVEFGLKLTDKKKQKVKRELKKFLVNTYTCNPLDNNKKNNDYAFKLYRVTKCKFYKINKDKYKIYFVDELLMKSISSSL